MAGGAPVPIPVSDSQETILSIADLEKAASKKLGKTAGGKASRCGNSLDSKIMFVGWGQHLPGSLRPVL